MNKFLFNPLGMDAFKASTPCIAPLIVAGLTAGAGLANSLIGSSTQNSANESYLKGVRETNQANKELYQMQVNDNRINWAMEQAYNTPSQQLARLRQAGINGSSVDGSPYGSIQTSTASAQIAPEQTPNPFANMNLGGITQDAISSYQSAQNIREKDMDLYMKGIDTQYYLTKTINDIDIQLLDLTSKEVHNDQDRERFKMLTEERKQYSEQLRLQRGLNQANIEKIQKEASEIEKRVFRDDKLALFQMEHWSKQDMIGFYEAQTGRKLAYIQEKHVDSLVSQVHNQILQDWHKVRQGWSDIRVKQDLNLLKKQYYSLDKDERLLTKRLIQQDILRNASEYQWMLEKNNAPINAFFRNVFGIDTQDVLKAAGAAGAAYVGARTGKKK